MRKFIEYLLIFIIVLLGITFYADAQISDPLEYPVGGVTYNNVAPAITQIKSCPIPRFKTGHTLLPNMSIIDPIYFGGYKLPGVSDPQAIQQQADIQRELIKNWNCMITVNWFGPGPYSDTCNAIANANPTIKVCVGSLRAQVGGTLMYQQGLPNDHYLQTGSGQFIDQNGNPTAFPYKQWRPTAPVADYAADGNYVKNAYNASFASLTRNVDFVMEDGEVYPIAMTNFALAQDPACVANRNLLNIQWNGGNLYPWFPWLGRKVADNDKAYSAVFMGGGVPRITPNTIYTEYRLDGMTAYQLCWQEARKMMSVIKGQYYSTTDLYVRWPDNWKDWVSAWHGIGWVQKARYFEYKQGDRLFSPFVAAGWDPDETQNVRPAQWLGIMKIMGLMGAEFYYPSYFVETVPPQEPKGYAWQITTPIYAQAVTSYWEDILRNGDIMPGDEIDNGNNIEPQPAYKFNTGVVNKLIYARKKTGSEVYVILGIIENSENTIGVTPLTSTASFTIAGEALTINISRKGNTFIWDRTNLADKKFYQLDAWHEHSHPTRWAQDITWDTEVATSKSSGVSIKTEGLVGGNYTAANSYIKFAAAGDTVSYAVQRTEPSAATRYFWIRARSATGSSTGVKIRIGGVTKNISCITDNTWKYYRVDSASNVPISFSLPVTQSNVILTAKNSAIEIDKFFLTESASDIYGATTTACSGVACTITPGGPTTFCSGGNVVLSANAADTYLWSTGATTQNITVTTSGNYSVTITIAGNSAPCAPVTVTVTPFPTATITAGGSLNICPGKTVTLSAATAAGNSYQWKLGGGAIGGATNSSYAAGAAGAYTCVVTNTSCSATSNTLTVTVSGTPTAVITAGGPTTFCTGGSVILTATANISYVWSTGATTQSVTIGTSGTYTVTVTNGNGCTAVSAPMGVTVNANPTATITPSGPTTFCTGGNVTLAASAGSSWLWSTSAVTQNIIVSTSGSYRVTVTNASGCTASSSPIGVTVNPPPTAAITAGGGTTFCAGGSVLLSATVVAGATYQWQKGGINIGGANASGYSATTGGSYKVIVTSAGCSATSNTIVVTVTPATTTANAGADQTICSTTATLGGNTPVNGTGLWTLISGAGTITTPASPNSGVTAIGAGANVFRWTISNAPCAPSADNVTITTGATNPVSVTISTPTNPFCAGATVTFNAVAVNIGAGSYQWQLNGGNVGANSPTYSGVFANNDQVLCIVTTSLGCATGSPATSNTITLTLSAVTASITAGGATTFCAGGSVVLTEAASAGSSYQWQNSGGAIAGATTTAYTATASENYSCVVTNTDGCTGTSNVITVTVNALPAATITPSGATTFCSGGSINLTVTASTTYLWSTGATTQAIAVTTSGTYRATVTDANGCTKVSAPVTVTVNTTPVAVITSTGTVICNGGSMVLTASAVAGASYQWRLNAGNIIGATAVTYSATAAGTYDVVITSAAGCTATSNSIVITVSGGATAIITAQSTTNFCNGDSVGLTANLNTAYIWNTGATTKTIYAKTGGNYTVTVTNAGGCTGTASIVVSVKTNPTVTISASGPLTFCAGGSVVLTASVNNSYYWSGGMTTQNIVVTDARTFTVTVTSANGCTAVSAPVTTSLSGCDTCVTPTKLRETAGLASVRMYWDSLNVATNYIIEFRNMRDTSKVYKSTWMGNTHSVAFTRLIPFNVYTWRIQAVCGIYTYTDFSAWRKFRTWGIWW